jgi:hypothetical protein
LSISATGATAQPDPAALFRQGVTWQEFLKAVNARQDTWRTNVARAAPRAEMVERLKQAAAGLTVLAVAESACSDSVSTLPYLAKALELAGIELRIVPKRTAEGFLDGHRTPDGRTATPTIVLLRADKVAGVWIERPSVLQQWHLSPEAQALAQQDRLDRKMSWYDWDRGDSTIAEIVALAERSAGAARDAARR